MQTSEQVLSQLEASYLAGEISEAEYFFQLDSTSPQGGEVTGGLRRSWAAIVLVFSLFGIFASAALLYEEYVHISYPFATLGCALNAKISCADAFDAWQGHLLFGIPNAAPGLLAFTALLGLSIYLLVGKTLSHCLWVWMLIGLAGGMGLVFWFLSVSLTVFHALCPFCLIVWATVINLFWLVLAVVLRQQLSPDNLPKTGFRFVIRFWFLLALIEILLIAIVIFAQLGFAVLGL